MMNLQDLFILNAFKIHIVNIINSYKRQTIFYSQQLIFNS